MRAGTLATDRGRRLNRPAGRAALTAAVTGLPCFRFVMRVRSASVGGGRSSANRSHLSSVGKGKEVHRLAPRASVRSGTLAGTAGVGASYLPAWLSAPAWPQPR